MIARYRLPWSLKRISFSTGGGTSLRDQLGFFPEFGKVEEMQAKGSFSSAVPELERMHEVLHHNAGATSPITLFVVRQISEAARLSGDKKKAESVLAASMEQLEEGPEKAHLLALRAYHSLVNGGELGKAEVDATEAVRICESFEGMHPDYLGLTYGLLGVTYSLQDGAHERVISGEAEEMLQMSTRWSQEPVAEMCAMNNLGLYHMYCDEEEGEPTHRDARLSIIEGNTMWEAGATVEKDKAAKTADEGEGEGAPLGAGTKEALAIWEEAMQGYKEEDNLLSDVDYAIAYAGVLTVTAQALKEHDPVRSTEVLSSALAAIDRHKEHVRARPMLGRILSLVAFNNMSASLAVTAEGLFRSSLDHLQVYSPYASHDARWRFEQALSLGGYGLLASKWEKREKDAERLTKESQALLKAEEAPFPFLFPDIARLDVVTSNRVKGE